MTKIAAAAYVVSLLVACGSDDEGGCADISGNWSFTSTWTGGTCDESKFGTHTGTITMRRAGNGWVMVFPGTPGGCGGDFNYNTCRFVTTCNLADNNGNTIVSQSIDWVFSGNTASGTASGAASPPAAPTRCTFNYSETAKR